MHVYTLYNILAESTVDKTMCGRNVLVFLLFELSV